VERLDPKPLVWEPELSSLATTSGIGLRTSRSTYGNNVDD
jgi:hypothetical protein